MSRKLTSGWIYLIQSLISATLAKSMGMHGEGAITDPSEIAGALRRAIEVVKSGKPALVDIVVAHR